MAKKKELRGWVIWLAVLVIMALWLRASAKNDKKLLERWEELQNG